MLRRRLYFGAESLMAVLVGSIFTFVPYKLWGFWCLLIPLLLVLFYFKIHLLWLVSLLLMPVLIYSVGQRIGGWERWSWLRLYAPVGIYYGCWFLKERELRAWFKVGISPEALAELHFDAEVADVKKRSLGEFEQEIRRYEDMMFGLRLYQETSPKFTQYLQRRSYERIEVRGQRAIGQAKVILDDANRGQNVERRIESFAWPTIFEDVKRRFEILVERYDELFPRRPRSEPLSREEIALLREAAVNRFF